MSTRQQRALARNGAPPRSPRDPPPAKAKTDSSSNEDEEHDGTELKINKLVEFPMEISDADRDKIVKKINDTGFKPTLRKTRGKPGSNKGVPSPNYFFVPGA